MGNSIPVHVDTHPPGTPILLINGTSDTNVPPGQSVQMYVALKILGKPVELVVYEDLQHSLIDSGARADMLLKSAKFFAANLPQ